MNYEKYKLTKYKRFGTDQKLKYIIQLSSRMHNCLFLFTK